MDYLAGFVIGIIFTLIVEGIAVFILVLQKTKHSNRKPPRGAKQAKEVLNVGREDSRGVC